MAYLVFLLIFLSTLSGEEFFFPSYLNHPEELWRDSSQGILLKEDNEKVGLFWHFATVVGALHLFDQGSVPNVQVDNGENGCYFNEIRGNNWWNYYFYPLLKGKKSPLIEADSKLRAQLACVSVFRSASENHQIISKYIRVRKPLLERVDSYMRENFKDNFVIGFHYRGTDKMATEVPTLSYEEVYPHLDQCLEKHREKDPLIFVATEDQGFLDALIKRYGQRVVFTSCERSSNGQPIHLSSLKADLQGEEAMIDCLLLAKTDLLLRTSSNLSLAATWFNPSLETFPLNPSIFDQKIEAFKNKKKNSADANVQLAP